MSICGTQKFFGARDVLCIVTCSNKISALCKSTLCKGAKLDRLVAHNVWIRRTAVLIGIKQVIHNGSLILGLTVPHVQINAKRYAHALSVGQIICPRTLKAWQVLGPVAHIDSLDVVARLKKQSRGQRRINATTHAKVN